MDLKRKTDLTEPSYQELMDAVTRKQTYSHIKLKPEMYVAPGMQAHIPLNAEEHARGYRVTEWIPGQIRYRCVFCSYDCAENVKLIDDHLAKKHLVDPATNTTVHQRELPLKTPNTLNGPIPVESPRKMPVVIVPRGSNEEMLEAAISELTSEGLLEELVNGKN